MIQGVPSFKGFHMTPKGRESLKSEGTDFIEKELLPTAKEAKADEINTLSIEDDGRIYIETPKYGKFTACSSLDTRVDGRYFSCAVEPFSGYVNRIKIPFKDEIAAREFEKTSCEFGKYLPKINLDLYKAIVAADAYEQKHREALFAELDSL